MSTNQQSSLTAKLDDPDCALLSALGSVSISPAPARAPQRCCSADDDTASELASLRLRVATLEMQRDESLLQMEQLRAEAKRNRFQDAAILRAIVAALSMTDAAGAVSFPGDLEAVDAALALWQKRHPTPD
jgi:hypothetical protein